MKFLGHASIALAAIIYAFFGVLARFVGFSIPIFYQNVTRNTFASLILLFMLFVVQKHTWKPMTPYAWKIVSIRALMGTTSFLLFFYTMNHMPIGMAYFLYYGANTFLGYFLGNLLFHERITNIKWIAFMLAFVGMASMYAFNFSAVSPILFVTAVSAGALCAGWFVIVKKIKGYSATQLTLFDNTLPIIVYLAGSLIMKEQWTMPTASPVWIASFGYGALFIVTGQLIIYGFQRVEAQIGSLILLIEIPIATLLALLFYHEPITLKTTIGGLFILTAIMLPELSALKTKK